MSKPKLNFVCPECGGTELDCIQTGVRYSPIKSISPDGNLKLGPAPWTDIGSDYPYVCCGCMLELTDDESGEEISAHKGLVKWLGEHLPEGGKC